MAITNLYSNFALRPDLTDQPILVVMHGYGGGALSASSVLSRMAQSGLFVISPGMRGRNGAGGSQDSSGRELYDIFDAVQHVRTAYSSYVSPTRAGIVGYSGGGGNALGCAVKFPDLFEVVVDFFGMSDYGAQAPPAGWSGTNTSWVGGTRDEVPDNYTARDHHEAIATNYTGGHLWLYHDEDDDSVPVIHTEQVADAMLAAGRTNYEVSITDSADATRWFHGNPIYGSAGENNIASEADWLADLVAGTHAAWTVPASGTVDVRGYIVTKRFEIWLGTTTRAGAGGGVSEAATVAYDTTTHQYTVTPTTGPCDVHITEGGLSVSASGITTTTVLTAV